MTEFPADLPAELDEQPETPCPAACLCCVPASLAQLHEKVDFLIAQAVDSTDEDGTPLADWIAERVADKLAERMAH